MGKNKSAEQIAKSQQKSAARMAAKGRTVLSDEQRVKALGTEYKPPKTRAPINEKERIARERLRYEQKDERHKLVEQ